MSNISTEELIKELLRRIGEDPSREGLLETPRRVKASLEFLTDGHRVQSSEIVNGALFSESYDEMVIVNIEFYSLCEHHLLPFYGRCHSVTFRMERSLVYLKYLALLRNIRDVCSCERMTNRSLKS